jgi:hypothetical protein
MPVADAGVLLRDMASDSAQRAANVIRPSQEQLEQLDQPAPEGTWHEKPQVSKDTIRARFGRKKGKAADTAQQTTNGVDGQQGAVTNGAGGATTEKTDGVNGTSKEKRRSKEIAERTRAFLGEKVPQERRDQTIWRLKKMFVEIQGHSDCKHDIPSPSSVCVSNHSLNGWYRPGRDRVSSFPGRGIWATLEGHV